MTEPLCYKFCPISELENLLENNLTHDKIFVENEKPEEGRLNTTTYEGVFCQKRVHIRRYPGISIINANLLTEISHVKYLKHRNILPYHEFTIVDECLIIITDGAGTTLSSYIKQSDIVSPKLDMVYQVALGLKHLHDNGVVHGNLTPFSISVLPVEHTIKLGDFGLRSVFSDLHEQCIMSDAHLGVSDWIAPEILEEYELRLNDFKRSEDDMSKSKVIKITLWNPRH